MISRVGILSPERLLGYRNNRVFIRNSRHSPPLKEAIIDAMEAFFACHAEESHSGVSAVLGHYFFVYIHPSINCVTAHCHRSSNPDSLLNFHYLAATYAVHELCQHLNR